MGERKSFFEISVSQSKTKKLVKLGNALQPYLGGFQYIQYLKFWHKTTYLFVQLSVSPGLCMFISQGYYIKLSQSRKLKTNLFSHGSRGQKSEVIVLAGPCSLGHKALGKDPSFTLPSFWHLLAIFGLWQCNSSLRFHLHMALPILSVSKFFFLEGHLHRFMPPWSIMTLS